MWTCSRFFTHEHAGTFTHKETLTLRFTHTWTCSHAWVLSHFSCVWLCTTLLTVACPAPLSMGFSRQEYWSGLLCPPPGDLHNPGFEPASLTSPALAGRFFTTSTTWKAWTCSHTDIFAYSLKHMCSYLCTLKSLTRQIHTFIQRNMLTHPYGRKWRGTKKPLDESETGEWKNWLKAQHSENEDHGIWSHHFMGNRWGNSSWLSFWAPKSLQMVTAAMKLKDAYSLEETLWPT